MTAMKYTAEVSSGKPIAAVAVYLSADHPLVAFYNIHGRNGEVLLFCCVPDTTQDYYKNIRHRENLPLTFNCRSG
jgi:hypothetical protein